MHLAGLIRSFVVIAGILACRKRLHSKMSTVNLKKSPSAANAFSLADPVPTWVEPASLPEIIQSQPIVIRLLTPIPRRSNSGGLCPPRNEINDASSLTAAGRISISLHRNMSTFELHAIHVLGGAEMLDRTKTSTICFLQREQGLEHGVYSGRVTASILIDDLRVGDTLDISYSTYGQNPVFGGKYIGLTGWDQSAPTLLRRVILNHPADRKIAWRMIGDRPAEPIAPRELSLMTGCADLNLHSNRFTRPSPKQG